MSAETPWGRFPDAKRHEEFGAAYQRLSGEKKAKADESIAFAAGKMNDLLGHAFLQPLLWPGIDPDVAAKVDMAERSFMAMGVFRLSIATKMSTQVTALSAGLDLAADEVDEKAAKLALTRLAAKYPPLAEVRPQNPAAYQVLLNRLTRDAGKGMWAVATEVRDAGAALDMTLETGLEAGVFISIVTRQHQQRTAIQKMLNGHADANQLPKEALIGLWLLAIMGMGRLFGEMDQTLAYAD